MFVVCTNFVDVYNWTPRQDPQRNRSRILLSRKLGCLVIRKRFDTIVFDKIFDIVFDTIFDNFDTIVFDAVMKHSKKNFSTRNGASEFAACIWSSDYEESEDALLVVVVLDAISRVESWYLDVELSYRDTNSYNPPPGTCRGRR